MTSCQQRYQVLATTGSMLLPDRPDWYRREILMRTQVNLASRMSLPRHSLVPQMAQSHTFGRTYREELSCLMNPLCEIGPISLEPSNGFATDHVAFEGGPGWILA